MNFAKKVYKRSLAILMSVFVLSFSVFSSCFGVTTVFATGADVPLSSAFTALYEMFLGIGSTVLLSTGVINDVEEVTEIDVAKFGADFMVNKMGLSSDTADIVCDLLLPNDKTDYSQGYADCFTAFQNGEITLEEMKAYSPVSDSSFDVYMQGLFDDLWTGITSFADDVIAGTNDIALGSYTFDADDISHYFGSLLADSDGIYTVNCSGSYHYSNDQTVEAYFTAGYRPFVVVASDFSTLDAKCCYKPDQNPSGISVKWSGWRYYGSGKYSIDSYSLGAYGALNGSWSVSCPMFLSTDTEGIQAYVASGDDSACINLEVPFSFSDVVNGIVSPFTNFCSKGAYKATDLYNSLVGTISDIASGVISDASTYVDSVSSTIDSISFSSVTESDITVDPIDPVPTTPPIEQPSSDADVLEWVKYIANTLSMSWSSGSDIPDILTGIGDYARDIPNILTGLNDGFSDVIEIGGNTWEVVSRIPDIIDKQAEATQEAVTKGFTDVIDIGGGIAEKVAEMPDVIDFAKDGILAGITDLGDTLSLPLSGILEGVNSHTGLLEGIKDGVLSIPDSISSSIDQVASEVEGLSDSIIDYSGLLQLIIELLKSILAAIQEIIALLTGWFCIDFFEIKEHLLSAIDSIPGADGLDPFLAIITDIKGQITDHYDYPKITIQTPEILLQFVKAPEIVLLDFKDYAEYFIWVRTAMAFAILFGFAMWCVRDIKVELTLN